MGNYLIASPEQNEALKGSYNEGLAYRDVIGGRKLTGGQELYAYPGELLDSPNTDLISLLEVLTPADLDEADFEPLTIR